MGVIINAPDPFIEYIEDALENFIDANIEERDAAARKQRKPKRSPVKPADLRSDKKNGGSRRKRRYDNVASLLTMTEDQDFDEVNIYDFIPQTVSAFAQLLVGKDTIKEFNKFINCSEEEQDQMINNYFNDKPVNVSEDVEDQRSVHPAFPAEECFQRLETRFRSVLKKKHLPLGNLVHLEEQVTAFFQKWPQSIYVSRLTNSYDRLILHALCQYLDLNSQSFDQGGSRQTRIKNLNEAFILPNMALSDYIEKRLRFGPQ